MVVSGTQGINEQGRQEQGGIGCDGLVGRPEVLGLKRPAMGVMHGAKAPNCSIAARQPKRRKFE